MLKKKKGFTLMEVLIVVAIIAILLSISIPVFASQLEKTREAVCLANCRSLLGAYRINELLETGGLDKNVWMEAAAESCDGEYSGGRITGLCSIKDAYYTVTFGEGGMVSISCSEHGDIIKKYADNVADKILGNVNTLSRPTGNSTQSLAEYFDESTSRQIDSEAPEIIGSNTTSWTSVIKNKVGNLQQSWALALKNPNKPADGYILAITLAGKLSNADNGKQVQVRYYTYDKDGKQISVSEEMANVKKSDKNGYPIIDMSTLRK